MEAWRRFWQRVKKLELKPPSYFLSTTQHEDDPFCDCERCKHEWEPL
jgi:DNA-directed RNA polymerase subunit M/transcription elongation factor TFIIS